VPTFYTYPEPTPFPPHFERDVLAGRSPALQVDVDATAMIQAGLGAGYAAQIMNTEIADYLSHAEGVPLSPVCQIACNRDPLFAPNCDPLTA
jgi:hypothetical protein